MEMSTAEFFDFWLLGQATPEKQKKKALTFFFFLSFL
jgi:hypothetical protein